MRIMVNRTRSVVTTLLAAAASALGVTAFASDAAAAPVRVPVTFQSKLDLTVKGKDGRSHTLREAFNQLDAAQTTKLPNGRVITAQQYVDMLESLHKASARHNLGAVPPVGFATPAAQRAIVDQTARHQAALTHATPIAHATHGGNLLPIGGLKGPILQPVWKPFGLGANYSWQFGNQDYFAGYTDFNVSADASTAVHAGCSLTWETGGWVLGTQHPLVRFTAKYGVDHKNLSADAALYVLGQATPVWHQGGNLAGPLSYSKSTPPASVSYDFVPGVLGVRGSAGASFTMAFTPTASSQNLPHEAVCSIGATPSAKVTGFAQASVWLGAEDLSANADLITAGVRADIVPVDVKLPVVDTLKVFDSPAKVDGEFKIDIDSNFMKGDFYAFYDIQDQCFGAWADGDTCVFGVWMSNIAEAIGVPMHWKHHFWKGDGYALTKNITDVKF